MRTMQRVAACLAIATALAGAGAGAADALHANESVTVSKTAGLSDGETVQISVSGFAPNAKPVKLVIAGQGELVTIPDKLNFDEYAVAPEVVIGPDGTGTAEFVVISDHGTVQDGTTLDCAKDPCWIVAVQEPFLPQPNYDSEQISFGSAPLAPAPVAAPPVTTAVVVETTLAPTTTAAPTTTTAAPTTTTTKVEKKSVSSEEIAASSSKDDGGGGSGPLLAIIAVVVAAVGAAGYFVTRKKPAQV